MKSQEIASAWHSKFGPFGPAGYLCRQSIPDRWVRIHSLPNSKRYPENETERTEIVRRHLIVADAVIGNADCVLFVTRFGSSADPEQASLSNLGDLRFTHLDDLSIKDDNDPIHFFGALFKSNSVNLQPLILAAADDSTGQILFANFERASAYAPYDGGADLFFPTHSLAADALRNWEPWLSRREDRL